MIEWLESLTGGGANFIGAMTGSAIGLIALLLGALFNAYLNRRRDDRLRILECQATAAALRAELSGLRATLISNAEMLDDPRGDFYCPDLSHSILVLPHAIPKFGLFDAGTIESVIGAYVIVQQYGENLIMLGGRMLSDMPAHRRVILMPKARAKVVAGMNKNLVLRLEPVIASLDQFKA